MCPVVHWNERVALRIPFGCFCIWMVSRKGKYYSDDEDLGGRYDHERNFGVLKTQFLDAKAEDKATPKVKSRTNLGLRWD
jgi:hypothetical protein